MYDGSLNISTNPVIAVLNISSPVVGLNSSVVHPMNSSPYSFTKAKNYEGAGASKFGSVFIYILVASIGMKMDLKLIFDKHLEFMQQSCGNARQICEALAPIKVGETYGSQNRFLSQKRTTRRNRVGIPCFF